MTNLDGISVLAGFFLGMAVGMAFLGICLVWDRGPSKPRHELGTNHDRLDAEARYYVGTRPTSSNRKAGRA